VSRPAYSSAQTGQRRWRLPVLCAGGALRTKRFAIVRVAPKTVLKDPQPFFRAAKCISIQEQDTRHQRPVRGFKLDAGDVQFCLGIANDGTGGQNRRCCVHATLAREVVGHLNWSYVLIQ